MIILMSIIIKRTDTCKLEILGLVSKLRRVDSVILMIIIIIILILIDIDDHDQALQSRLSYSDDHC